MDRLVASFARIAARSGWNERTLVRFCQARGMSAAEQLRRWPRGVRSVAWEWNVGADAATAALFGPRTAERVSAIVVARFEQNRRHKAAVRRLAASDLFHPLDTLRRTAATARLMQSCRRGWPAPTPGRTARLTLGYSLLVLLWLVDRSEGERITRRATAPLLRLLRVD